MRKLATAMETIEATASSHPSRKAAESTIAASLAKIVAPRLMPNLRSSTRANI
ncbi:MAG TPA: hypothetical protein VEZ72_24885 [Paenibacillus sp.]|nr:hypothetical protein [Paenibacillus sp.]